jgi:predicted acyl esterase
MARGDRILFLVRPRNCYHYPQTFVPSIFWAKPGDYRSAVQRIHHAPGQASFIELPLVTTP